MQSNGAQNSICHYRINHGAIKIDDALVITDIRMISSVRCSASRKAALSFNIAHSEIQLHISKQLYSNTPSVQYVTNQTSISYILSCRPPCTNLHLAVFNKIVYFIYFTNTTSARTASLNQNLPETCATAKYGKKDQLIHQQTSGFLSVLLSHNREVIS